MKLPKLLIVGHGRHGKDTVCEMLEQLYGFTFESSSRFCSRLFIYNKLKDLYGYQSEEECYQDRHNHRIEWYELIHNYCSYDLARLGKAIFSENDIYCGLRNRREFHSMKNQQVFDYCIWVDRSDYLPKESVASMTLEPWMADYVIDNNGDLARLQKNVVDLMETCIFKSRELDRPDSILAQQ